VAPTPTTVAELMEGLDIVLGQSQMLQGTFQPGSSHIRLGSWKAQFNTTISGLVPGTEYK
jgi:hypothetical protein